MQRTARIDFVHALDVARFSVPAEWVRGFALGWEVTVYSLTGSEQRIILSADEWSATRVETARVPAAL